MADTIKTNLGPVTAYADAKAHGYTGTREEFGVLLANAGLNLKAAETAKEGAEAAKQAAEAAQQDAAENQKNTETQAASAKASADTAAEQAAVAKESAADAANSATAAQESETNAGLSATSAANAEAAAKQAQNAAETAKADAETAKTVAGNSADAAANSAADAKKTLESIPADYSTLSGKVNENTSGISDLKEDLDYYYPKKQGAFKCVNMVSNLPDEVIMPSGIEKNILDGVCVINGTSTVDYPNFIIKKSILANHVYLLSVKMKENEGTFQTCSLITRIGTTPITRNTLGEYPVQLFEYKNYPEYTAFCGLFSHDSDVSADFSISFDLTKTGKKVAISVKDIIITDVTGLSDIQITEIVKTGMANNVYYNPGKNIADSLIEEAENNIINKAIKKMKPNPNGYWYGKKCLVIGDSTSATEQWQKKLSENLGMSVTTHAKGGIGFLQMVVGSLGYEGDYDNETGNTGVLQPLKVSDVYDKHLIIIFGGFNNRGTKLGEITDLYKTDGTGQNTVTGQLQFVLNWIYDLLKGNESYAQNLKCKIVLVTPYCCGKYSYVDYDGYGGDSWAGYTLREMCNRIVEIASLNNCSSYNAWENSGIGRHTWTIYSASPTATKEAGGDTAPYPTNADQLHLNNSVGYPHLGDCISAFVSGIV